MKRGWKIGLWLLPLIGLAAGYAAAYIPYYGLLERWHPLGNPGEKIERILGMRAGERVVVATEAGEVFSLKFYSDLKAEVPAEAVWEKEESGGVDPPPREQYHKIDFITRKPRFEVVQQYEMEYFYLIGKGEAKFALDEEGNLWIWQHHNTGLTGLVFYFFPVMGFLTGAAISVMIGVTFWLRSRRGGREV